MPRHNLLPRHTGLKFFAPLIISACTITAPQNPASEPAPKHPTVQHNAEELIQLQHQLTALQQQLENLNKQVKEIGQQQTTLSRYLNVRLAGNHQPTVISPVAGKNTDNTAEAHRLYRAGLYAQAIRLLKNAESGGDGSSKAQERMWLLLQNHARLNNCESVINIGQRFNSLYPHHSQSANALYLVAQCQNRMQQQDIARVTCKHIINTYPNSAAAVKAKQFLNKKK